jgi:hypothetical protein
MAGRSRQVACFPMCPCQRRKRESRPAPPGWDFFVVAGARWAAGRVRDTAGLRRLCRRSLVFGGKRVNFHVHGELGIILLAA